MRKIVDSSTRHRHHRFLIVTLITPSPRPALAAAAAISRDIIQFKPSCNFTFNLMASHCGAAPRLIEINFTKTNHSVCRRLPSLPGPRTVADIIYVPLLQRCSAAPSKLLSTLHFSTWSHEHCVIITHLAPCRAAGVLAALPLDIIGMTGTAASC